MRVFKLAQSWKTMRVLLSIIVSTLGSLANLTAILGIIMFIFAAMGKQLFQRAYNQHEEQLRWNFKDFYHAFLMVFRILCGEWIEPLWDCMRIQEGNTKYTCMIIFFPTLIVGNFMVLNLFLALLLNSFASDSIQQHQEEKEEEEEHQNQKLRLGIRMRRLTRIVMGLSSRPTSKNKGSEEESQDLSGNVGIMHEPLHEAEEETLHLEERRAVDDETGELETAIAVRTVSNSRSTVMNGSIRRPKVQTSVTKIGANGKPPFNSRNNSTAKIYGNDPITAIGATPTLKRKSRIFPVGYSMDSANSKSGGDSRKQSLRNQRSSEMSLDDGAAIDNCFPDFVYSRFGCCTMPEGRTKRFYRGLRRRILQVVDAPAFEWTILILIMAASITLCFEDIYLYQKQMLKKVLYGLNVFFAAVFTLEMILKWLAYGFKTYFTNTWSILDFVIVVISVMSLMGESSQYEEELTSFRSLRTVRSLRPLRAISRWEGMKIVVNALMYAIPSISNVILVCLVFWLIFSIMGVQFFAGMFDKCVDQDKNILEWITNKTECLNNNNTMENGVLVQGRVWYYEPINFNNVLIGYVALFQVATFEGWMEIMRDAADSVGIDQQPRFENSKYYYLFFFAFIIFGSFFTLNLFIGVIIDNFNMLKKRYEGGIVDMFLTPSQRQYYTAMKKLVTRKPKKSIRRPKNPFQQLCYDLSLSQKFETIVVLLIFLNMIALAFQEYRPDPDTTKTLEILNLIFTTIFTLEAIIKIIGLRQHYFTRPWNVFDFFIVIISILGIAMQDILQRYFVSPTLLRVARVFRIGRILRLVKAAKGIRKLMFALVISLPALFNIAALLFIVMFIFAIIGMNAFGHVKLNGALDDTVNFQTFGNSMVLLFRLATAAGWNDVLDGLLISEPFCNRQQYKQPDGVWTNGINGECGDYTGAIVFFFAYILMTFMIVINMYIAVILENFNEAHQQEEAGITEDDIEMFYCVWEKYDPKATQYMSYTQLEDFLADLDPPLGMAKPNAIAIAAFELPIKEENLIHCLDILYAVVRHLLGAIEESEEFDEVQRKIREKFEAMFPNRLTQPVVSTTMMRRIEWRAAVIIQRAARAFLEAHRMKKLKEQSHLTASLQTLTLSPERGARPSSARQALTRALTRSGEALSAIGRRVSSALSVSSLRRKAARPATSLSVATSGGAPTPEASPTRTPTSPPEQAAPYLRTHLTKTPGPMPPERTPNGVVKTAESLEELCVATTTKTATTTTTMITTLKEARRSAGSRGGTGSRAGSRRGAVETPKNNANGNGAVGINFAKGNIVNNFVTRELTPGGGRGVAGSPHGGETFVSKEFPPISLQERF